MVEINNRHRKAYSVKSAAAAIDSSITTIRRRIESGDLRAKRLGKKIVILDADLQSFLEKQSDYK